MSKNPFFVIKKLEKVHFSRDLKFNFSRYKKYTFRVT